MSEEKSEVQPANPPPHAKEQPRRKGRSNFQAPAQPQQQQPKERVVVDTDPNFQAMDMSMLKHARIDELQRRAGELGVDIENLLGKSDLVFALLRWQAQNRGAIVGEGVLETFPDGYGFLREPSYNYEPSIDDVYVAPSQIRAYGLRTGDTVRGQIRPPLEKERYYSLVRLDTVNSMTPGEHRNKVSFDNLTAFFYVTCRTKEAFGFVQCVGIDATR